MVSTHQNSISLTLLKLPKLKGGVLPPSCLPHSAGVVLLMPCNYIKPFQYNMSTHGL